MKCLIVDDEPRLLNLFKMWFHNLEHTMDVANNGKEGLNQIKTNDYDFVITDIMMPVMDGIEFVKKALEIKPSLFIILMTGAATDRMIDSALSAGCVICIRKPLEYEDISKKIDFVEKSIEQRKQQKKEKENYARLPFIIKLWRKPEIKNNFKTIVYILIFSVILGWFISINFVFDDNIKKEKPKDSIEQLLKIMKEMTYNEQIQTQLQSSQK